MNISLHQNDTRLRAIEAYRDALQDYADGRVPFEYVIHCFAEVKRLWTRHEGRR